MALSESEQGAVRGQQKKQGKAPARLRENALGLPSMLVAGIAAIAPAASMVFNVPIMASQAGASAPLALLFSTIVVLLLVVPISSCASMLSSAGGLQAWVKRGLGHRASFQTGWILLGAYGFFEAALHASVGSSIDYVLTTLFSLHVPGGWITIALALTVLVCILSYFGVKLSLWVMAPFALAEILVLFLLNTAITLQGGIQGHDLLHTFTLAGSQPQGAIPGGMLGIGLAMALGILAYSGFETVSVYGEEVRQGRTVIPRALFSLIGILALLYVWTAYSAVIGFGWQQAATELGDVARAPEQYVLLSERFVGKWLGDALLVLVLSSNFASSLAMHQTVMHYLYAMGRERAIPAALAWVHPRWRSPVFANAVQSWFCFLVLILASLFLERNSEGETLYAFGMANEGWQHIGGITAFGWIITVVTILLLSAYLLVTIATPMFAKREGAFRWVPHLLIPVMAGLLLLLPLASFVLPSVPLVASLLQETLGIGPAAFPGNVLPSLALGWWLIGGITSFVMKRKQEDLK